MAYSAYHSDGGTYRRRRQFGDGMGCVCAMHYGEDNPSCKPADTRVHRRRMHYNMVQTCIDEACCGPDHTSCFLNCPVPLPDDASVGAETGSTEAPAAATDAPGTAAPGDETAAPGDTTGTGEPAVVTTAAPTAEVTNSTRALLEDAQDYYGDFLKYSTVVKDIAEQKRSGRGRRLQATDEGAGRMCPAAPEGCYEDFMAGGNSWSSDPDCEKMIGENMMCDQAEDTATASTEVEESGSRLAFVSAAFFVWFGCA